MIAARRLRLDAVGTGLPAVMWTVIIAGAFISLSTFFFFKVEDVRLHAVLASLLAIFMGLAIFLILSLDRPFRGDLGSPRTLPAHLRPSHERVTGTGTARLPILREP